MVQCVYSSPFHHEDDFTSDPLLVQFRAMQLLQLLQFLLAFNQSAAAEHYLRLQAHQMELQTAMLEGRRLLPLMGRIVKILFDATAAG